MASGDAEAIFMAQEMAGDDLRDAGWQPASRGRRRLRQRCDMLKGRTLSVGA
jgi:hypothetical protein